MNLLKSLDENDKVWGVAYEIDDQAWKQSVMAHLDHREKGGYTQHIVRFYPRESEQGMPLEGVQVTVYVGDTDHRQYAGPDSLQDMAETILTSVGPSGKNVDYLYNLANAMRSIDPNDEHIFSLEKAVRSLEKSSCTE